jgi:hypothetical protein
MFSTKFRNKSAREKDIPCASAYISDCCEIPWNRRVNEVGKFDEKAVLVIETIKISAKPYQTVGSEPLQVTGKIKDLKIFNISGHIGDIWGIFQQ